MYNTLNSSWKVNSVDIKIKDIKIKYDKEIIRLGRSKQVRKWSEYNLDKDFEALS